MRFLLFTALFAILALSTKALPNNYQSNGGQLQGSTGTDEACNKGASAGNGVSGGLNNAVSSASGLGGIPILSSDGFGAGVASKAGAAVNTVKDTAAAGVSGGLNNGVSSASGVGGNPNSSVGGIGNIGSGVTGKAGAAANTVKNTAAAVADHATSVGSSVGAAVVGGVGAGLGAGLRLATKFGSDF